MENEQVTASLLHVVEIETPLGIMYAGATSQGVCLLEFTNRIHLEKEFAELKKILNAEIVHESIPVLHQLKQELTEYFAGTRKQFTVALHMPGSEFEQTVWNVLLQIPYGQTWTYKQQSETLNNSLAIRAMAAVNGKNRLAIVVPCHRVIGSNGKLVGYAAGIERKKWLLNFERENSDVQAGLLF